MRLSAWARKTGLSHKTARRLWKTGRLPFLPAEQLATGTVIVHEKSGLRTESQEAAAMKLVRAYKTELAPDDAQLASLYRHAGAARFAYNWGLECKSNVHLFNLLPHPKLKTPTAVDLHRELNRLKKTKLSWLYEVSKCAPQEALRDLDTAFSNFFGRRAGPPNFKSRKRGAGSFTLTGGIKVRPGEVRLPRIGWVRLKERGYIHSRAHINSVTVSERAKRG